MGTRTVVPGSWRLGGPRYGWPTAAADALTVADGLTLAVDPGGPRSFASPDGTLGGLVLPPTLATGGRVVWLADRETGTLRRFDPIEDRFLAVAARGTGAGAPRAFGRRAAIAATCGLLTVADPDEGTVVVVETATMTVRSVLRPDGRRPVALAAVGGRCYVLDDAGRLTVTSSGTTGWVEPAEPAHAPDGPWDRLAVDREGRACRVDTGGRRMAVPAPGGGWEVVTNPEAVRSRFAPPEIAVDPRGRFRVPARFRLDGADGAGWCDAHGEPCTINAAEYAGRPPYLREGWWTSRPFDSGELGCRWYRLTVEGSCPPGCTTTVATYTDDERVQPDQVPPEAWSPAHRIGHTGTSDGYPPTEHAVLSPRGRFLVLRIGLTGDGWSSPAVGGLVLEPETPALERFLPAVYRSDDADFLRRFLAIFGTEIDTVEQALRSFPARFSPRAVPDSLLDRLAGELGVPLERSWTADQRRAMLVAAPRLLRRRGTPTALRALLRAHLEARTGHDLHPAVPVLVEGFRERPGSLIGQVRLPTNSGEQTWSDQVVDRPVLGRRHADSIALVSVGDPALDRFRVHAHRFRVVVPRPLVPGEADRASLERLIAAEKPAHVQHELQLVEPRAVVGEQGSLGVDTVVGDWPPARLAADGCRDGSTLGLGLRLAGEGGRTTPVAAVGRGGRVGVGSVLV